MNQLATGAYFLSQILASIWAANNAATVKDMAGNIYSVWALLNTLANPRLLNAIFYWNADARSITFVYASPGLAQPYPINGWVNQNANVGGNGQPGYSTPPVGPAVYPQPITPPASNQGSVGLSGALTPFGGAAQTFGPLVERPLYHVWD